MEVHHHSHQPDPGLHRGKKWTHYFWEFLMLFLAVFCGFLAEYQLEHKIERDREKKFIETFIEDLKTDTTDISRVLLFRKQKMERMDSLMLLLSTGQIKENDTTTFIDNNFTVTLPCSISYNKKEMNIIPLRMDMEKWFYGPNVIDFNDYMGIMDKQNVMSKICENGRKAFSITEQQ